MSVGYEARCWRQESGGPRYFRQSERQSSSDSSPQGITRLSTTSRPASYSSGHSRNLNGARELGLRGQIRGDKIRTQMHYRIIAEEVVLESANGLKV